MIERGALFARAEATGLRLTKRQLWHWQQEGLIEPAELIYGEGRGARSYYADDTLRRAEIIVQALRERRDIDHARLTLWREGFPVNMRGLFERGITLSRMVHDEIEKDRQASLRDDQHTPVYERPFDPKEAPLLRKIHKRTGLPPASIRYLILSLYASPDRPPSEELRDSFTLGVDLLDGVILRNLARLVQLPISLSRAYLALDVLHAALQPDNLDEILSDSSDAALQMADEEFRAVALAANAVYVGFRMKLQLPPRPLFTFENNPPEFQVMVILTWQSALRDPELRAGFEDIMQTHRTLLAS